MQLEIKNIGKCYGEKEALKELTLRLSPGIYGLLGPNGAGKSTPFGCQNAENPHFIGWNAAETYVCSGTAG